MNVELQKGITGRLTRRVEEKDTAAAVASGLARVYATPCMVALMEEAAYTSVQEYLPEGYSTVGTQIDVTHSAATPVGMEVTVTSTLVEVDRRRLVFQIMAVDEAEVIGKAMHTRFIVENEKFLTKAYGKKNEG